MSETVYLDEGGIKITNARAVIEGNTYSMANITSVGVGSMTASPAVPFILFLLGVLGILCALSARSGDVSWMLGWLLGVLFIVGAVVAFVRTKDRHYVRIVGAGGEQKALIGKDRAQIEKIVAALNEAIIKRG